MNGKSFTKKSLSLNFLEVNGIPKRNKAHIRKTRSKTARESTRYTALLAFSGG